MGGGVWGVGVWGGWGGGGGCGAAKLVEKRGLGGNVPQEESKKSNGQGH